jgi:S1-C subfamily serine protease
MVVVAERLLPADASLENLTGLLRAVSGGRLPEPRQPPTAAPLHAGVHQRNQRLDIACDQRLVRRANRVLAHRLERYRTSQKVRRWLLCRTGNLKAVTIRSRLSVLAATGLAIAASLAGYAWARPHANPIGTGVVVIESNLAYGNGESAGTGMVLTSSGRILTNNHVVRGASTIKIVVPGTGHSYSAKVVGYDVTDDVAVIQASRASNLKTVSLGTSTALKVGQTVKTVGNAGGGGSLVTSAGTITGLSRTITVNDESGGTAVLRNLIETDANLEPGDSGGPTLNAAGKVIGMNAAASASAGYSAVSSSDGYAIPINRAVSIAKLIVAGKASTTVHVGGTAFLGVATAAPDDYGYAQEGAIIAQVVPGSPAENAGLVSGDLITTVDGTSVSSPQSLSTLILTKKPGTTVTVAYLDQTGAAQTTRVTLASGPPQ